MEYVTKDELQEQLNQLFRDLYDSVLDMALARNKTAPIKFTTHEGADYWTTIHIHSLEMPDGTQWDARNGWRNAEHNKKQ